MKKTEITFVRDMESPKINSMLMSDITFVNFEKRRYINTIPINAQNGAEKVIPMKFDPECKIFNMANVWEALL